MNLWGICFCILLNHISYEECVSTSNSQFGFEYVISLPFYPTFPLYWVSEDKRNLHTHTHPLPALGLQMRGFCHLWKALLHDASLSQGSAESQTGWCFGCIPLQGGQRRDYGWKVSNGLWYCVEPCKKVIWACQELINVRASHEQLRRCKKKRPERLNDSKETYLLVRRWILRWLTQIPGNAEEWQKDWAKRSLII